MIFRISALPAQFPPSLYFFLVQVLPFFLRKISLIWLLSAGDPEFQCTLASCRDCVITKDNSLRGCAALHAKSRRNSPHTIGSFSPKHRGGLLKVTPRMSAEPGWGPSAAFLCKHCHLQWGLHRETEHNYHCWAPTVCKVLSVQMSLKPQNNIAQLISLLLPL